MLTLVTAPTAEPVTVGDLKDHARITEDVEDVVLVGYIRRARAWVEERRGIILLTQTWDYALTVFPREREIQIPLMPLQSVESVTYTPEGGIATVWPSTNYVVDLPGSRIVLPSTGAWPSDALVAANGVVLRVKAGFGDERPAEPSTTWEQAVGTILELASHFSEHREAEVPIPVGTIDALWGGGYAPYA